MLKFRNAQPEDEGFYLCRIETKPPVSEVGHIKVLVPPTFQDKHTGEITVQENSNIVISCKAQGNPNPTVKWHREDCRPFFINSETVTQYVKQELHFEKVHRSHMGAYLCVASNGVPPTISRRTYLKVTFSPTIYVRHNMVTAPLRKDLVTLECRSEAYPPSTNYWLKDNYLLSKLPRKYEEVFARSATKTHMKLLIRHVQKDDYGSYSCVASNKEGEAEGSVDFHEIPEQVESPNHLMEDITSSFNNSWDMFEETSNYATSAQNFHNEDEPHHHWKSSQQPGPTSSVERVQNAGSPGSRSIPLFQLLFSWLYLLQREHVQL
ncbi:lachesin-like [Limulus polyphemus]|uniref:Lachesin-like n=1 Tax=Limulus polyphemus TaxID=6850 RepID=A0ABM1S2W4_LIMPO|nr:lachesin-like [Limulus polyphemus]